MPHISHVKCVCVNFWLIFYFLQIQLHNNNCLKRHTHRAHSALQSRKKFLWCLRCPHSLWSKVVMFVCRHLVSWMEQSTGRIKIKIKNPPSHLSYCKQWASGERIRFGAHFVNESWEGWELSLETQRIKTTPASPAWLSPTTCRWETKMKKMSMRLDNNRKL